MKGTIFWKKAAACLLAFLLACLPGSGALAAQETGMTAQEDASAVKETEQGAKQESSSAADPDQVQSDVFELQIGDTVVEVTPEEIMEYYELFQAVIQSEEFQSLIQYEEVRELIRELIERSVDLVWTDRELTRKILTAAGVDEKYVEMFMQLLQTGDKASEALEAYSRTEEGQELLAYLGDTVDQEELADILEELLLEYVKSVGENAQAQTEAELEAGTETKAEAGAETQEETKAEAGAGTKEETKAEAETETQTE